jgi:hypothetical protein
MISERLDPAHVVWHQAIRFRNYFKLSNVLTGRVAVLSAVRQFIREKLKRLHMARLVWARCLCVESAQLTKEMKNEKVSQSFL